MSNRRHHISLTTKLASALLALGHIDYEESKKLSAKEICARFEFDHYPVPKALGGSDEPWNLTPRLIADHAHKTNKDNGTGRSDRKVIAKVRNSIKKANERAERIEAEQVGDPVREHGFKRRWPSRDIPSRPFQKREKSKRNRIERVAP